MFYNSHFAQPLILPYREPREVEYSLNKRECQTFSSKIEMKEILLQELTNFQSELLSFIVKNMSKRGLEVSKSNVKRNSDFFSIRLSTEL